MTQTRSVLLADASTLWKGNNGAVVVRGVQTVVVPWLWRVTLTGTSRQNERVRTLTAREFVLADLVISMVKANTHLQRVCAGIGQQPQLRPQRRRDPLKAFRCVRPSFGAVSCCRGRRSERCRASGDGVSDGCRQRLAAAVCLKQRRLLPPLCDSAWHTLMHIDRAKE